MTAVNPVVEWTERLLETPPRLAFGYAITTYGLIAHPSKVFEQRSDNLRTTLTLPPATFYAISYALFLAAIYLSFVVAFGQTPIPLIQSYFGQLATLLRALDLANALILSIPFICFLVLSAGLQKLIVSVGGGRVTLAELLHGNFYAHGLALGVCAGFWGVTAAHAMARHALGAGADTTEDTLSLLLATLAGLTLIAASCIIAAAFHYMVLRKVNTHILADLVLMVFNAATPIAAIMGVTWLFSR